MAHPLHQAGLMQYTFGEGVYVTMSKRLSAAYQRAVQTPGKFKGKTMVVRVPLTVDMTRT